MKSNNKISNFFNPISNPSGGILMNRPVDKTKLTVGPKSSLSGMFSGQPPVSQAWKDFGSRFQVNPQSGQLGRKPVSSGSGQTQPAQMPAPMGEGSQSRMASAPGMAPGMAPRMAPVPGMAPGMTPSPTPEAAPQVPSQWMKPDGTFFTPDEVASNMASTLQQRSGGGDIGTIAGDNIVGGQKTTEQLETEARILQNTQGDIASGAEDPFGIASDSGIAYSPQELQAIENAYAGIYDPAIESARNKVMQRRSEEQEAKEAEIATSKAETEFQNDLTMLGIKHGYDLEKMKADQEYQTSLASYKASLSSSAGGAGAGGAGAGGAGADNPDYVIEQSVVAIRSIDNIIAKIDGSTSGMFNSASNPILRQMFDGLAGSDAMDVVTSREALEAIVGFDTLNKMRQAARSGASGLGQVTERELKYLQSVQGSLNELQSNTQLFNTLREVRASFARIQAEAESAGRGPANAVQTSGGSRVLISPSGESFDASDLTPEEYQEAIADGFRSQ